MSFLGGCWLTGYFVTSITKRFSLHSSRENRIPSSLSKKNSPTATTTRKMSTNVLSSFTTKPPNILVYTGTVDKEANFDTVRDQLCNVVSPDSYTVYSLDDHKVLEHPWSKNSVLLIIYSKIQIKDDIMNEFKLYVQNGGCILSVGRGGRHLVDGVESREFELHQLSNTCKIDVETESLNVQEREFEVDCEPFYYSGKYKKGKYC